MKKLLSFIVMTLMGMALMAKPVDPTVAVRVAQNFAATQVKMVDNTAKIVYTHPMPNSGQPAMYVVNVGSSAFVIVAADDIAHPVLGYSMARPWPVLNGERRSENGEPNATEGSERASLENGERAAAVQLPSQVSGFLDDLASQIRAAQQQDIAQDRETATEWQRLLSSEYNLHNSQLDLPDSVGPLLTTTWDQGQYYNALCPEDTNGPDGHALTGCVATAMAQIINYWGYPVHGRGTHSYNHFTYGTLSVNYDSANYDYANMPSALTATSTPQQVNAVAQLMRDCGVAANMGYGPTESSSYDIDARAGMINFFRISPDASYAEKAYFANDEWNDMLRTDLGNSRVVMYSGHGTGGHTFVCDGYNANDYYHFNFGWSGYSDGWYLTSVVNPSELDFNSSQHIIVGIVPDSTGNAILGQMNGTSIFRLDNSMELYHLFGRNLYGVSQMSISSQYQNDFVFYLQDTNARMKMELLNYSNQTLHIANGNQIDNTVFFNTICTLCPGCNFTYYNPPVVSDTNSVACRYLGEPSQDGFCIRIAAVDSCQMISNVTSVPDINNIQISWKENGNANQWDVEYGPKGFARGMGTITNTDTTTIFIGGLDSCVAYDFYIRPSCHEAWYGPYSEKTDLSYWQDYVNEQPSIIFSDDGYALVSSPEQLAWLLRDNSSFEKVRITADLDMSGHRWKPVENCLVKKIDGGGHSINNLLIREWKGLKIHIGFLCSFNWHTIDTVMIRDLTFANPTIFSNGNVRGCGVLAGIIRGESTTPCIVLNCGINGGSVECSAPFVGGLVGESVCNILNSYANISIKNSFVRPHTGGLIGQMENGLVQNCYSASEIVYTPFECSKGQVIGCVERGTLRNVYGMMSQYPLSPQINLGNAIDSSTFRSDNQLYTSVVIDDSTYNDLCGALNKSVRLRNDASWRLWRNDSILGHPVFDGLYSVTCNNISNLQASNVQQEGHLLLKLEWDDDSASSYLVKCINLSDTTDSVRMYTVDTNPCYIEGLMQGDKYEIYVKCNCDSSQSGWGEPTKIIFDKIYWSDIVTSRPDGYMEDPFGNVIIASAEGLSWFASCVNGQNGNQANDFMNKTVSLIADIDLAQYKWMPIGNAGNLWGNGFKGVFDGNGHTVSNMYVNEDVNYVGFFGYLFQAKVVNVTIVNGNVKGDSYVGGLCGSSIIDEGWWNYYNNGPIAFENCNVLGTTVYGKDAVGLLCGLFESSADSTVIRNCSSSGSVYGGSNVAGLIGEALQYGAKYIENCFTTANVMCNHENGHGCAYFGGLIGYAYELSVENCYSAGAVDIGDYTGSMIGVIDDSRVNYLYGLFDTIHDMYTTYRQYSIQNTRMFYNANNQYLFQHPVAINSVNYSDLLSALNAWVDENNTDGQYFHWRTDTANINGGYPVFEVPPCLYVPRTFIEPSITACDSYTFNGVTYTESVSINDTLQTVNGCDSIVSQLILINHPVQAFENVKVCEGQSYTFNGRTLTETNWYYDTIINGAANGCDSIVSLWLEVQNPTSWHDARVCEGQSYTFNGRTLTETNWYYDTIFNGAANGCDSIVYLWLEVRNNYSYPSAEICQGESYSFAGQMLTESGTYFDTLTSISANGCDSIVQLSFTVHPTNNLHDTVYLLANSLPYLYTYQDWTQEVDDFSVTMNSNTQIVDTRVNPSGTIYDNGGPNGNYSDNFDGTIILTADEGEAIKLSGNYQLEGCCDYIAVYDGYGTIGNCLLYTCGDGSVDVQTSTGYLTVRFTSDGSANFDGFTLQWNTQRAIDTLLTATGDYTFEAYTSYGCDNTFNLHLEPRAAYNRTDSVAICSNNLPYAYADTLIADAGTYTFTYLDQYGIDSTVTLHLTINQSTTGDTTAVACDSFTWWNTNYTNSTNEATHTLTNAAGCDSSVTLHLTINNPVHTATTEAACETYTWNGTAYTVSGDYTYSQLDNNGCTQVDTLHLTVNQSTTGDTTVVACDSFIWWNTNYTNSTNEATHTLTNAAGCDSVVTLHLTINHSTTGVDVQTACDSYTWIDGNTYTESNFNSRFSILNSLGCDSTVTLNLTINHSVTFYDTLTIGSNELPYDYYGNSIDGQGNFTFEGTTSEGCDSTTHLFVIVNQVGIGDVRTADGITLFPNPTRGTVTASGNGLERVEVMDVVGRTMLVVECQRDSEIIDLSELPQGTYVVRIIAENGTAVRRVVKR